MLEFTTDELITIVWICQCQSSNVLMQDIKNGKDGAAALENPLYNRICEISDKAYSELTDRDFADK